MIRVRVARPDDAAAIAAIYAPFVTGSPVSFEETTPDTDAMRARMAAHNDFYPWLVAAEGEQVAGYAYADRFRPRSAYRFVVETTVYVAPEAQGRGIGRLLYGALMPALVAQGFTQAIAAITLPNAASVALHEAFGFVHAGTYARVGWKLGRWHDVGLWQAPLAPAGDPPQEPQPFAGLSA